MSRKWGPWFAMGLLTTLANAETTPWIEELDPAVYETLSTEYGNQRTRAELEALLPILDPKGVLRPYYEWKDDHLLIRIDRKPQSDTVLISLRKVPLQKQDLAIRRVALDPGHFGGEWSKTEWRHVQDLDREAVREGSLTWGTTRLLEDSLQKEGVEVQIVREAPPSRVFPDGVRTDFDPSREAALWLGRMLDQSPYSSWFRDYPSAASIEKMEGAKRAKIEKEPFQLYNSFDLQRRAFETWDSPPDLTISIHFNAKDEPRTQWTTQNGVSVFVLGDLHAEDAGTASERFYFFRRWLDGTTPAVIELAGKLSRAMQKEFGLGPVKMEQLSMVEVMNLVPVDRANGVFAQNLAILRRTRGPALLVEGPYVNNREEYERLIRKDVWIDGVGYPVRVKQYADAIFSALKFQNSLRASPRGDLSPH